MTQQIQTRPVLCNVCGSSRSKPRFSAVDRLHGFAGQFQYVRCADCGLLYMNPQITPQSIPQFYPAEYGPHQEHDKSPSKPNLPKIILDTLNARSRVLDVGCGNGDFLNHLRQFCRCRVDGVDLSENAVRCAKNKYGLDVFRGELVTAPYEENSFDLITLFHCIEHMPDPAAAIKKASSLCKPAGWLHIETPNLDGFAAKFFKDKWYHLDCPRHLFIFSPSVLKALLEKSGLEVVKISYEKSSKGLLASLQYVFYGDNYRPRTKNKLRRSSFARFFVSPLSRVLACLERADIMMITARRKKI